MSRTVAFFAAAAVLLGIALGSFMMLRSAADDPFAACRRSSVAGGPGDLGGDFTLTDGSGARVTAAEVIDRPTLLYFGYSFCPDFCPTDLARNAIAADILAERGVDVGQVFVSIDPARDTPAVVGDYAAAIHPDLVGLTGSDDDIAAATGAYRVYYRQADDDPEYYLMDHSTFTYLVAPGHPFLEFYSSGATPEEIADSVACYAERL